MHMKRVGVNKRLCLSRKFMQKYIFIYISVERKYILVAGYLIAVEIKMTNTSAKRNVSV